MRRPARVLSLIAGAAALAGAAPPASAVPVRRFHADHVLGTSLDMAVAARDPAVARAAVRAARAEIARLDTLLGRGPGSALARLNAGEADAPDELREVLATAARWRSETGGAFDERLGAVADARRAGDPAAVHAALRALRTAPGAATAPPPGVRYDLDGLAKGYVVDRALAAARRAAPGAQGLLLDLGGDLRCDGRSPDGGAWRVGVGRGGREDADAVLRLSAAALAVSGAGERDLPGPGDAASHLTRPADAAAAPPLAHAAVTAPRAADADALATALCIMPAAEGLALAERLPGVEARLTDADGRVHATSGWAALEAPRLVPAAAAAAWPAGQALTVAYEVPRIAAPKYYAPYLVIWITDADHQLVRTLTLLGTKPRYLESNYVWWRRYGRGEAGLDALAKPTRAPGRYTAVWDGTDAAGARVAAGRYTVHAEAARQDGGHTYETLEVSVGAGGPSAAAAPAKDEIGALRVSVGPASRPA